MMLENIVASLAWIALALLIVVLSVMLVVVAAIVIKLVIDHWRDE